MEVDDKLIAAFARLRISEPKTDINDLKKMLEPKKIKHPSFNVVPQFFKGPPLVMDDLRRMLRNKAQKLFLRQKAKQLPTTADVTELYYSMEELANNKSWRTKNILSYSRFCHVPTMSSPSCHEYLKSSLFNRINDAVSYERSVDVNSLMTYVSRKIEMNYYRISLAEFDEDATGYLSKNDLERFINAKLPVLSQLNYELPEELRVFYVCTVIKQVFFHLDPMRTGRVSISDLLASGFVALLMNLGVDTHRRKIFVSDDTIAYNMFCVLAFLDRFMKYIKLDTDRNGVISEKELAKYKSGNLNSYFIKRIFEESPTYNGGIDYKVFVDVSLVLENLNSTAAMNYVFRMLDVDHTGFLTQETLRPFHKGLEDVMIAKKVEVKKYLDFCNEIFDLVRPKDPSKITLADIKNSLQPETMITIMINFKKFWEYNISDKHGGSLD